MKKKKGFTLVELLAVIVILAIIALITVPMLSNVIKKSKLGAMEDSAYGLIDAANYYYAEHMSDMKTSKIFVIEDGVQTSSNKLNYKGNIEGNAKVLLTSSGKVALCLTNGKNYVKKSLTDIKVVMNTVDQNTTCNITEDTTTGDVTIDITGETINDTINVKLADMQKEIDELKKKSNNMMVLKLIWENPNKDSKGNLPEFKPQKLSLDLSGYDAVMITTTHYSRVETVSGIYPKGLNEYLLQETISSETGDWQIAAHSRRFTMDDSGITFYEGRLGLVKSSYLENLYMIPYQIFGIKYSK